EQLAKALNHWQLKPAGTEGWRTAEVTMGGVVTDAISQKDFSVRDLPQLAFIGEVLDVTGELGGYNFQWAWSSAVACGLNC
ncbi:NAD(P)/FAD-dependent oxidoreductase, partial [Cobetia marina]